MVAPMKVNRPLSTCGKKASCWLLLKRCTSSTNTRVRCGSWMSEPCGPACSPSRAAWARSTASRMSFTPPSTALMLMNCASNASAISRAMVVLPTPGGPHRMQLCGRPDSNANRSGMPGPNTCCWPTTSARVRGRRTSARGWCKPRGPGVGSEGFRLMGMALWHKADGAAGPVTAAPAHRHHNQNRP